MSHSSFNISHCPLDYWCPFCHSNTLRKFTPASSSHNGMSSRDLFLTLFFLPFKFHLHKSSPWPFILCYPITLFYFLFNTLFSTFQMILLSDQCIYYCFTHHGPSRKSILQTNWAVGGSLTKGVMYTSGGWVWGKHRDTPVPRALEQGGTLAALGLEG